MQLKSGIKLVSELEGIGEPVKKGDRVTIRLNGWLNQGDPFQENYVGEIVVGSRFATPGIEYSLEGMKRGKKKSKNQSSPWLQGGRSKRLHPGECGACLRN